MTKTAYDFKTFVARHNEVVAQAILEDLEKKEGVFKATTTLALQTRWDRMMNTAPTKNTKAPHNSKNSALQPL